MTNINCSSNCIFQKDGKCDLDIASTNFLTPYSDCSYFKAKNDINNI